MPILAQNAQTAWRIIMPHPAHETVKLAAHELHALVAQLCGAQLPTQTELQPVHTHEILVGRSGRLAHYGIQVDWEALGEEGFVMKTGENWLLLAGATPRGTLYAVYTFLEEVLGLRFLASDCTVIPHAACVAFPELDDCQRPAFESREAYWSDAFNGSYAVRNKMNANKADISIRQGGRLKFYNFHHSFDDLVPVRQYFDTHPEYFSLVDGVRKREHTQLCLSNPAVIRLAITQVRRWIAENPDCRVFSVAQNDWHNYCTCPMCAALDEAEGSPAASVIRFVNTIGEDIEKDFPQVLLHTFAYQYTRKAPRTIRPRSNVIVRLCSIECCFSHPLDGQTAAPLAPDRNEKGQRRCQCALEGENAFLRDLREWGGICQHLYVWDYVTNFREYLMPLPNLDVLQRNLQLFRAIGVKGVFEQGNFSQGGGGHLAELQAYLQAKLMWNPDCDLEQHLNDFLDGFYGHTAAPFIRQYLAGWQQASKPWHVTIFDNVFSPYVTDELIAASTALLGQAEWLAQDDVQRQRIHRLTLSMNYLTLARMPRDTPGREALVENLGWELRRAGYSEIRERWPLDESIEQMKQNDYAQWQRSIVNDYKM